MCSVLFSFLTATIRSLGSNVFIVKIRLEFVFKRCEKRISAFDSSLAKAVYCSKQGEIRDKYTVCVGVKVLTNHKLVGMRKNQTQTTISI